MAKVTRVVKDARNSGKSPGASARREITRMYAIVVAKRRGGRFLRARRRGHELAAKVTHAAGERRTHRARNAALIVAGTGALAGAAYAGKRKPE